MEDQHLAIPDIGDGNSLYAVFDGHGGASISEFLKTHFLSVLLSRPSYKSQEY